METATMRDDLLQSPQPALTMHSGSPTDENENPSRKAKQSQSKDLQITEVEEEEDDRNSQSDRSTPSSFRNHDYTKNDSEKGLKSLRSARKNNRKSDETPKKSVNNNDFECPECEKDFGSYGAMQVHLKTTHPEKEIKCEQCCLNFDSQKVLTLHRFMVHSADNGRRKKMELLKGLKHVPKVIGFQDIDFIDFSSEKFPLIAKNICEESLHLSKDEFSFDCSFCGRGFPCDSALEIHGETCEGKVSPKRNKRKSTPKFRPQNLTSDSEEDDISDRTAFFNSLDLKTTEQKSDLADIQSMITVTNIMEAKQKEEKTSVNLNIQINNSPNYGLVSPDLTEEEAQDCFAAECRRMKLRGEFPCKLCTAVFPNLRALKGHNRVHILSANGTPNSPYRCNICTYSSLDKATLVRHMRSHNGDRPYECGICNYAFTTKANCERHLRNRHAKMTRDDVKSSIIYHPSEDPINDSDYQKTTAEMNKKNVEKSKEREFTLPMNLKINLTNLKEKKGEDPFQLEHRELIKNIKHEEENRKSETGTMTDDLDKEDAWYEENNEALDLRVNKKEYDTDSSDAPQDLSKKEDVKEFNNNINNNNNKPESPVEKKPPPPDVNSLVKLYSRMYPNLNLAQVQQVVLAQLNLPGLFQRLPNFPFPPFLMFPEPQPPQKDLLGLQMSGGNLLTDAKPMSMSEKLQIFQQQALAEMMLKREKDRINENFEKHKRINEFIKQNTNEYFTETDKKVFNEILSNRMEEEKKDPVKIEKPGGTAVKMVIKNGVLMPKQKQRRYRTERPFSCEHCSARFTLRSNMERHIKQQHPQYWTQKSRSNVGSSMRGSPIKLGGAEYLKHYVSIDTIKSSGGEVKFDVKNEESDIEVSEEEDEELVIDEKREECEEESFKESKDLASVSRMLDAAVTQTQAFQKYFQEGEVQEEERSEEEEGLVAGSTSSDDNSRSETESSRRTKKKSAYSLAPNRVSCPYCFRKFPWTSSLRRHVLTHTGQKPFKCTHCPLLFTTKSNCDRHLLRKHGRDALIASCGQTENSETQGGYNSSGSQSQSSSYTMRNVPERPFKCSQCPSSTFSTLSNLNKHLSNKHHDVPEPSQLGFKTGPPNVTISPTFPLNIPKQLVILPALEASKIMVKMAEGEERGRKRSSSDEGEGVCRKRMSPELKTGNDESDQETPRSEPALPPSDLPFKCHLCEGSFPERSDALDHIRFQHSAEFQLLVTKGALEATTDEERHEEGEEGDRGRFPDYAHRKVMCAFCMRRFWSAEDLRRHMRTHTGERPFSCDVCHRRFTLKHSMLRHRKKHNSQEDVQVASDEEHQFHNNNNNTVATTTIQKASEEANHRTILHQTLTRSSEDPKMDVETILSDTK